MPDVARAIRVLENELECCKRPCARDECGKCDLVMDADWLAGGLADAIELLKEQETVVRCKDCKYAYLTDDGECKYCEMEKDDNGFLIERYRSWDWFCADGERKEGGEV